MLKFLNNNIYSHPFDLPDKDLKQSRIILSCKKEDFTENFKKEIEYINKKIELVHCSNFVGVNSLYNPEKDFNCTFEEYDECTIMYKKQKMVFSYLENSKCKYSFHIYLTMLDNCLLLNKKEDLDIIFEIINFQSRYTGCF